MDTFLTTEPKTFELTVLSAPDLQSSWEVVTWRWSVLPGDLCGFACPTWGGAMAVPSSVLWSPRCQGEGPCRQRVHQSTREASVGLRHRCETEHFIPVYWTGDLFPDLRLAISPFWMSKSHELAGSQKLSRYKSKFCRRSCRNIIDKEFQVSWTKWSSLTCQKHLWVLHFWNTPLWTKLWQNCEAVLDAPSGNKVQELKRPQISRSEVEIKHLFVPINN